MTKKLRHGSLFTGVGGVDLGLQWAGFETVWQVELGPFVRRVLEKQWPGVRKFEDVRECGKHNLEPVDIISGGYPCQDHSIAGKGRGLGTAGSPTERSGLWFEYRRIISELRPRWVLIENVSRLFGTQDGETVLDGLEEIGYSWWSRLLDAAALGAPHKRERAFILCHDNESGDCDFESVIGETVALPPECERRMEQALEKWNYWKDELAIGAAEGCPTMTTTPTGMAVLEPEWPDGRINKNGEGRWRKWTKRGTEGSASWPQEIIVRAVTQRNPRLLPTPECCEDFMGFPRGWTCLAGETTGLPEELMMEWMEESDAETYARIVRGVGRIPDWRERMGALGNAVVVQVPMIIGACVQRCESRLAVTHHAWAIGTNEDGQGGNLLTQRVTGPQNSRHLSPVGCVFETLGVEGTRRVYTELNAGLEVLASTVVRAMEELVPSLARMQALLSQRGADRKMVLRKAGLPTWTQWAEGYARSLHCTLRTIQRHIVLVREGRGRKAIGPWSSAGKKTGGVPKPARLDARQQAALVKAHMAANGLAVALRDGADWHAALAEFERVAVAPAALGAWSDASSRQQDWKTALVNLVDALEPCGGSLPRQARNALQAARSLLAGWTGTGRTCGGAAKHDLATSPSVPTPQREGHGCQTPACIPETITLGGAAVRPPGRAANMIRLAQSYAKASPQEVHALSGDSPSAGPVPNARWTTEA
jgi:DNA (cytosine-5)-methyltransferase 1